MSDGRGFPAARPRRLRRTPAIRRLVAETRLHPAELVLPVFVREGIDAPVPISAMPGVVQHTLDSLVEEARRCVEAGLGGIMVFGVPGGQGRRAAPAPTTRTASSTSPSPGSSTRSGTTSSSWPTCASTSSPTTATAACSRPTGRSTTTPPSSAYAAMALAQAATGAHVLGLSGMMDGQVGFVRAALDAAGHTDTVLLAYAAKYTSALYGPFREAVQSSLTGDRAAYQQDPANGTEALRELGLDIAEGADIVMVKPAGPHLDVIAAAAAMSPVPVAAYQISGEYSQIEAAAERGWIDRDRVDDGVADRHPPGRRAGHPDLLRPRGRCPALSPRRPGSRASGRRRHRRAGRGPRRRAMRSRDTSRAQEVLAESGAYTALTRRSAPDFAEEPAGCAPRRSRRPAPVGEGGGVGAAGGLLRGGGSGLLGELDVDDELDLLGDQDAALFEVGVPGQAPVGAVELAGGLEAGLVVAPRVGGDAGELDVEGDRLGDALDGQVAGRGCRRRRRCCGRSAAGRSRRRRSRCCAGGRHGRRCRW